MKDHFRSITSLAMAASIGLTAVSSARAQSADEQIVPNPPSPVEGAVPTSQGYHLTSFGAEFTGVGSAKDGDPVVVTKQADGRFKISVNFPAQTTLDCAETLNNQMGNYYSFTQIFNQGELGKQLWHLNNNIVFLQTVQNSSPSRVQIEVVNGNKVTAAEFEYDGSTPEGLLSKPKPIRAFVPAALLTTLDNQVEGSCTKTWNEKYLFDTETRKFYSLADTAAPKDFDIKEEARILQARSLQIRQVAAAQLLPQ